ncbi:MAG: hypothetical protein M0R37_12035 [Bacteroidales bacterium]|jgi:hypothetical protein|nr:hypothetical protein [Sphaerochaeta sp.]MCK9629304.1 hypothetical protein [Bacteroidales bacterium]
MSDNDTVKILDAETAKSDTQENEDDYFALRSASEGDDTILQVPSEMVKFESRAGGALRMVFDSQENIPPQLLSSIVEHKGKTGWLCFLPSREARPAINPEDVVDLPSIPPKDEGEKKTPSQRLHAVLFLLWKERGEPTKTFDEYYRSTMEQLIEAYKAKLPSP